MQNQPEVGGTVTHYRRRPTRQHRHNRRIRLLLLLTVCLLLIGCFSSVALHYLAPSLFQASRTPEPDRQASEASLNRFLAVQQAALDEMEKRTIYKYSVVPGGVRTVRELREAAERDPVVAAHYAGFDYNHARVVKLILARTAYISYRIGNHVYWTRHRVSLKKGETVITDGKMTARTRCANRVEETPQQMTSQAEPPVMKFDEPINPSIGTAISNPPMPFQSSIMNRTPVASSAPPLPLGMYDPLGVGQNWTPITPPPLPQVCGIGGKKTTNGSISISGKKKKGDICAAAGGGVGVAPEPGTWLLVGSGLVLLFWKSRDRFVRVRS